MMNFIKSFIVLSIVITVSCKTDTKKEAETVQTNTKMDSISNESQPNETLNHVSNFEGVWKRVSYPYGIIQIQNDEVKFDAGEGTVELLKFEKFKLSETCEKWNANKTIEDPTSFLITLKDSSCTALQINKDTLYVQFTESSEAVQYLKLKNDYSVDSNHFVIPEHYRGKWAQASEHCSTKNHYQMQIDLQTLNFFEHSVRLIELRTLENDKITGIFSYQMPENQVILKRISLSYQNDENTITLKYYDDQSRGEKKYINCK